MPRIPIHNIGSIGVIKDLAAHELPPEAWTLGENVRFHNNRVKRMLGHTARYDPPSVAPVWALGVASTTVYLWLYCSLTQAFVIDAGTHTEITRLSGNYSAAQPLLWNGGILGGIPVINNGVDVPQYWSDPGPGVKLADLPNWPGTLKCDVIRPFKNFLIAMNLVDSGTRYPHRYRWSHPAEPGAIPSSWDIADATKDAGEAELSDVESGVIRDGLPLGDIFLFYKERAVHGLQFIGGNNIFRSFPILEQSGILTTQCVKNLPTSKTRAHFVASGEDLVIIDGQRAESLLTKKWRRFLASDIDPTNFVRSFVCSNPEFSEMWFVYPENGATDPTAVIVWSFEDGTITKRGISDISFIANGVLPEVSGFVGDWDSDSESWDADSSQWGGVPLAVRGLKLLACDPVNTKLYEMDRSNQFNGSNFTSFVERTGLAVAGQDRHGNPKVDFGVRKLVNRVWIKATGSPFQVRVGKQETLDPNEAVVWSAAKTFTPGTDKYLDFNVNGRLIAIRFESNLDGYWEIEGYDLELEPLGFI